MENRMTKNYENMKRPAESLKGSVDILRQSVKDLYELDEDNYLAIKKLKTAMEKANVQIDSLTKQIRRNRAKTVLGFIGFGGLLYFASKAIDELYKRINELEYPEAKTEDTEESDG